MKPIKKYAGYFCLVISTIQYLTIFTLPFIEIPTDKKVAIGSVLYGISYVFMFAGFGLLGKEIVDSLKARWRSFWKRKTDKEIEQKESD